MFQQNQQQATTILHNGGGDMKNDRMTAILVGAFFLIAMMASLIGGGMLETIFNAEGFIEQLDSLNSQISVGVLLEVVNALAVLGIAFLMFPIIRRHNEGMAIGYAGFRILESLFCILAALFPMVLVSLDRNLLTAGNQDIQAFSELLLTARAQVTGVFIPLFFGLGALIFYTFLYRTRLLPRFIAVWGWVAVVLMYAVNLVDLSLTVGIIFALPIILNEILMGFWLIMRGFERQESAVQV